MENKDKILLWNDFLTKVIEENQLTKLYHCHNDDTGGHHYDEFVSLNAVFELENIRNICDNWIKSLPINDNNDLEESNKFRDDGNKLFMEKNFWEASKKYTKAIYKTTKTTKNLEASKAHANRAAAFLQMGFYDEALSDCQCAIDLGFPKPLLSQLYLRLADCANKVYNEAQLEFAVNNLNKMKNDNKLDKDEEKQLELFAKSLEFIKNSTKQEKCEEIKIKNKQKVLFSSNKGRYIIAAEDISENEMITTENAFVFVPILNDVDINEVENFHCQNCAEDNVIPFPCYSCHIAYCSLNCRNTHYEFFHKYECIGYKKFLFQQIGIAYLAFRTFIRGFPILYNDFVEKYQSNDDDKLTNSKMIWLKINELINLKQNDIDNIITKNSNTYYDVLSLVHNFDKINKNDLLKYHLTGIMLTLYIKNCTNFYSDVIIKNSINNNNCNWDIIISLLITRHICQMICNAHTIDTLIIESIYNIPNIWLNNNLNILPGYLHLYSYKKKIFTGIYPTISLYNHSCEPNFRNRFNKSSLIIIANKNIKKQMEIYNCYGENYKLSDIKSRRIRLKQQYHFDCNCVHCSNENSDYEYFNKFNLLKCNQNECKNEYVPTIVNDEIYSTDIIFSDNIKCPKCCTKFEWNWYSEFIETQVELQKNFKSLQASSSPSSSKKNQNLFEILYDIFFKKSIEFLCDIHVIRQNMALLILETAIEYDSVIDEINFSRLIEIGIYALDTIEKQYSSNGLEFIRVSTYVLDLLAMRNQKLNKNRIRINYDLMKILHSFETLNTKTKHIFVRYFDNYIL